MHERSISSNARTAGVFKSIRLPNCVLNIHFVKNLILMHGLYNILDGKTHFVHNIVLRKMYVFQKSKYIIFIKMYVEYMHDA